MARVVIHIEAEIDESEREALDTRVADDAEGDTVAAVLSYASDQRITKLSWIGIGTPEPIVSDEPLDED